jgi:CRISPR-associated protein Csh1
MFNRLSELGRTLPIRQAWERINEGMPDTYDRGIALCFDERGDFRGVKSVQGNSGVVYRSGPPNGTDLTPCCKLAGMTRKRLLSAAKELADYDALAPEKKSWLDATIRTYEGDVNAIWSVVLAKKLEVGVDDKTHRAYVYWSGSSPTEPVFAWPESKGFMERKFLETFAQGGERSGVCAVCGAGKDVVVGNYSVLACYNLDKPGSIAGGFEPRQAHRNFPVCRDCVFTIAEAFAFVQGNLTSSMAHQAYMILPYATSDEARGAVQEVLRDRPQRFQLGKARDIVAEETELQREFADYGDQVAFGLYFFNAEQASWRIQAEVQEVLPSRMRALYEAAEQLSRALELASEDAKAAKPFRVTAQTFKTFSGTGDKASAETVRNWLAALFERRAIDPDQLLHHLVAALVSTGKTSPQFLQHVTRQAWGLYRYALLTGLTVIDNAKEHREMSEVVPDSAVGRYIEAHRAFFSCPEKVVAFLTGCYCSVVTSMQYKQRKAAPFAKKFVGRLLSKEHLQRLYREGHAKLAQYDSLGLVIRDLDPDLAAAWVACGDAWQITDGEATFAFTIGYSLAYRIKHLDAPEDASETE